RVTDSFEDAKPEDSVSFVVICQPASGINWMELQEQLHPVTLKECLPDAETVVRVREQLIDRGFEVFEDPSPIVSARGPVQLFQSIFAGQLVKRIRTIAAGIQPYTEVSVITRSEAKPAASAVSSIDGALRVSPVSRPLFVAPSIPPVTAGFNLHVPGDIAQLTQA